MASVKPKFPQIEELEKFNLQDGCVWKNGLEVKKYRVRSFSELVALTSLLNYLNKEYLLLYRGQVNEYDSTFLPRIYRDINTIDELNLRFKKLEEATAILLKSGNIPEENQQLIAWSIIQHYFECAGTPFLDLTQSIRVAHSFATDKVNTSEKGFGYVYVFGVPYSAGMISSDDEITNIRLLSLFSCYALRPQLQEGYLICHNDFRNRKNHDFNNRLIAVIEIPKKNLKSEKKFHEIPNSSLLDNYADNFFGNTEIKEQIENIYK